MLDRLLNLVGRLGHWAYLIIFLAVTLESAAFLGFVVPGEALVLLGGFLAAQGVLDLGDLMVLVCLGAVLGDSIGYEVGRYLGRDWLQRRGHWVGLGVARWQRVEGFFARHGGKAVFLGRFSAFLRAMIPFAAGATGMKYSRFLFYNASGGILWSVVCVLLGYFLGASWRVLERWIGRGGTIALAIVAVLIGAIWLWRRWRRSGRSAPGQSSPP